ncbi:T9SS type A sorting domain-containing protein [Bacteroidota bacterium]
MRKSILFVIFLSISIFNGFAQETWYSYQSGDWDDWTSWTLDGSAAPLLNNPDSLIPSSSDDVVITSGRTITININDVILADMKVLGVLDVAMSDGHDFTITRGSGKIRIAGDSTNALNFPVGDSTSYISSSSGGTLEFYGTGFDIDSNLAFNTGIVNLTNTTDILEIVSDISAYGSLTVQKGVMQINDGTANVRSIDLFNDLIIESDGSITIGTGNERHQLDLYGDLTNNGGSVKFSNRDSTDYPGFLTSEAIDGIVDVNFLDSLNDQTITCNGLTEFYRIEIDKATISRLISIEANSAGNFVLFGPANDDNDTTVSQLTDNDNALGLLSGTVQLGTNVSIPSLNVGSFSDFVISSNAAIRINSGSVTKDEGSSMFVYGYLTILDGTLEILSSDGVILKDAGQFRSFGGTSDINQLYAQSSPSNGQLYSQTGGTVTIAGVDNNTSYRNFDLNYNSCTFVMSGGTLNVKSGNATTPGIRISSDDDQYNVTGGSLILEFDNNNANTYQINSTADFWSVTMKDSDGAGSNTFQSYSMLKVLNDFIIEDAPNAVIYNADGFDVSIGRGFQISDGSTYTPGSNNTRFTGSINGQIDFESTTRTLAGLDIVKDNDAATVTITQANSTTAISVSAELRIESGNLDYDSYTIDATGNIYVADSLGADSSTGELELSGGSTQTITSEGGTLFNVNLDNSNNIILDGDLSISDTLTMTNGVFDIGTSKLTIDGANGKIVTSGAGFSSTKMIMTSGYASDGGLERYVDNNETLLFPIGTDRDADGDFGGSPERYTPADVEISNYSDDGYIRISLNDGELAASQDPANTLTYYWRVRYRNFTALPDVTTYDFYPVAGDIPGQSDLKNYYASKIVDGLRSRENTKFGIGDTVVTFDGDGTPFTLESGLYTAGKATAFSGNLKTFGTIRTGVASSDIMEWADGDGWEYIEGSGGPNTVPGPGDIAIIRSDGTYWHRVATEDGLEVAELRFDNSTPPPGGELPQLDILSDNTVTLGELSGEGHIRVRVNPGGGQQIPVITADIEGTLSEPNTIFEYNATEEAVVGITVPTITTSASPAGLLTDYDTYPNLIIAAIKDSVDGFDGDFPFRFTIDVSTTTLNIKDCGYLISNSAADGDITVTDSLAIGDAINEARLQFNGTGSVHTVTINGDIEIGEKGQLNVEDGAANLTHQLEAYQDITIATGGEFVTQDSDSTEVLELELKGTGNHTFTADSVGLYRVIMNKGTDTTSTFTFNSNLTFHADVGGATSNLPVILQNGLLKLNNSSIADTISYNGGELKISSTTGLEIQAGEVYVFGSSNIRLDGLLRISGGTLDMEKLPADESASIRFSSTGAAKLEITGGSIEIAGSIRRDVGTEDGILKYIQTGGTLRSAIDQDIELSKGAFEIPGSSSSFTFTGGDIIIVSGNGTQVMPSILITPGSYSISDTITIGDSDTPNDGYESNIGIYSSVPLSTIELNNDSGNDPDMYISTNDLELSGSLIIAANSIFNTSTFDMTIGGNLDNDGTFQPQTGSVIFNSGAHRYITGTATTNFYDLQKAGSDTLSLTQNVTVTNNMTITTGVLNDDGNTLTLQGNLSILGAHISDGGEGIKMAGTDEQQLSGITSGTAYLGVLTITNDVIVPANGYNFNISDTLWLNGGIFDIGGSLVTIDTIATIETSTAFGSSNMVQTNSSFTDNGIKKIFPANYTTDFTFPVGEQTYTPVVFDFGTPGNTSGTTAGSITVRPANETHPIITEPDSALAYYWILRASNIMGMESYGKFYYDDPTHVNGDDAEYVPARYLADLDDLTKFDPETADDTVDEGNNFVQIYFNNVSDNGIKGDFFAGDPDAIPDDIATYTTIYSGNVNVDSIYTPNPGGTPRGAKVIVSTDDTLTFNIDHVSFYQTEIYGMLIVDETIGHRLGDVSGSGTLKLVSNGISVVIPAGYYSDFFGASGGTFEYAGTGSYDILGGITQVKSLRISDGGAKTMGNNDLTILDDFTITGSTFSNPNNRSITVGDNMLVNGGDYQHGSSGTLSIADSMTVSDGTFNGGTGGAKTISGDLNISGTGNFEVGSGGSISVGGDLTLENTATFDGGSSTSKIVMNGTSPQTLTGTFTGDTAIYSIDFNNSSGFILGGDIEVEGTMGLLDGLIDPNSSKLLVKSGGSISPSRGTSSAYVNGSLSAEVTNAGDNFIFPIGKGIRWRYASVNNVSAGGLEWTAEFFTGSVLNEDSVDNLNSSDIDVVSIKENEYWKITDNSSGTSAEVGISWCAETDVSSDQAVREDLVVLVWNDTTSFWDNKGGTDFLAGHTQSQGDFKSDSAIYFSEKIIGLGSEALGNPLPISLLSFEGKEVKDGVLLKWITATETNNDYFEIEHSPDGEYFNVIGGIEGQGTTVIQHNYSYMHYLPAAGFNYYRLKQVDFDGEYHYSKVIMVNIDAEDIPFYSIVFPNPVTSNYFTLRSNLRTEKEPFHVVIFDATGRIMLNRTYQPYVTQVDIEYNLDLRNGMHFIHVYQGEFMHTVKFVVRRQ